LNEEDRREGMRRDGPEDRRETGGWKHVVDNKVVAPLLVVAVLASLAWLSGVSALPAVVEVHAKQIVSVQSKVDALERNEIRRDEAQKQVLDLLKELREDVKSLRGQR
jgi:septal ring factor EnvC (AmiA/AmiB activator)